MVTKPVHWSQGWLWIEQGSASYFHQQWFCSCWNFSKGLPVLLLHLRVETFTKTLSTFPTVCSCWDGTCKKLNNFTILCAIIMELAPIDSASKLASGTIIFVCVQVCKSNWTENPIHCQWHTFHILWILAPQQCSLSSAFPYQVHVTLCDGWYFAIWNHIPGVQSNKLCYLLYLVCISSFIYFTHERATFVYLPPLSMKRGSLQAW